MESGEVKCGTKVGGCAYIYLVKYAGYYIKKKKKRKNKFKMFLCVFFVLAILFAVYYVQVVTPIVVYYSEEKVRSISTSLISSAISDTLSAQNTGYDELVTITYDSEGKISLISLNSVQVNLLAREVTSVVQTQLDNMKNQSVEVSLGTFTGLPFLVGVGPMVSLRLVPVGSVVTEFFSTFEAAGINQTHHYLTFSITASVGVVMPLSTKNFSTTLDVIVCESVIVGEVPSIYLSGSE